MMIGMNYRKLLALVLLASASSIAQQTSSLAQPAAKTTSPEQITVSTELELDTQAIVKETEQVDSRPHKMGIFWWVPAEFREASVRKQGYSAELARKVFGPFRGYNVFLVAVGDPVAGIESWTKEPELRKKIVLRDQRGNIYKPLEGPPDDLRPLVATMKPVMQNMLGSFGEGLQFMVFPAKDNDGNVLVDPRKSSEIFLDVSDLMGPATSTYTWRFPLSSMTPPKLCPVGKEKVEANWKYCPWHGNKLEGEASPAKSATK
jgi:hypothetical protein